MLLQTLQQLGGGGYPMRFFGIGASTGAMKHSGVMSSSM
jgi:hypothetical protein